MEILCIARLSRRLDSLHLTEQHRPQPLPKVHEARTAPAQSRCGEDQRGDGVKHHLLLEIRVRTYRRTVEHNQPVDKVCDFSSVD